MSDVAYIYGLKEKSGDAIRYIGKTVNLRKRLQTHLSNRNKLKIPVSLWIKSVLNNGGKVETVILDECSGDWGEMERHYIMMFRSFGAKLTNLLAGGANPPRLDELPKEQQLEILKKKSELMKGRVSNRKGCTQPESAKRAISLSLIGRNNKKVVQMDCNGITIKEWPSLISVERELGISYTGISSVCNGAKNKITAGGFCWKFKN